MQEEQRKAILVAVTQTVRACLQAKPIHQPNGGTPMWWPLIYQVLAQVTPGEFKTPNEIRKRYSRLAKKLGEEGLQDIADTVHPDTYQEAVNAVLGCQGVKEEVPEVEEEATASSDIVYPDLKQPAAPGWGFEFLRKVAAVQHDMRALDTTQNIAHAVIPTDLPVGVIAAGDFHVGGRGTDHERFLADLELWQALSPAVKVIGMGDYGETFQGRMAQIGLHQHVMTLDSQVEVVVDLFTNPKVKDLWLLFLKGNHDGWCGAELSNYVMRMAHKCGAPFLGLGGELYLTVGKVEYKIAAWHRYPGSSAMNKGNNPRRVRIDHNGADVVMLAHLHNVYVEFSQTGEQNHVSLRCGAYKTTDEHARDAAGNVIGDFRMPMVILNPKERDLLYFEDFRKGAETLLRLRQNWRANPSFSANLERVQSLLA